MKVVPYGLRYSNTEALPDRTAALEYLCQSMRAWLRRASPLGAVLGMASVAVPAAASAQADFPSRPLTFIAPAAPGGAGDTLSRILAKEMEAVLKQAIVVENKPGAGSTLGYNLLARSKPDGYSLGVISITNIAIASASKNFKDIADLKTRLAPVGGVATTPHFLVVSSSLPVTNVKELIALLKKEPGKYNFASQGQGSVSHLEGELFKSETEVEMVHIPYQGSAPALMSVISGSAHLMFDSPAPVLPHVKSGALRILAVAGTQRSPQFPDIPTLSELGMKRFQADNPLGLFVPADTPSERIQILSNALKTAMQSESTQETLKRVGLTPRYMSPAQLTKVVDDDVLLWPPIVRAVEGEPSRNEH